MLNNILRSISGCMHHQRDWKETQSHANERPCIHGPQIKEVLHPQSAALEWQKLHLTLLCRSSPKPPFPPERECERERERERAMAAKSDEEIWPERERDWGEIQRRWKAQGFLAQKDWLSAYEIVHIRFHINIPYDMHSRWIQTFSSLIWICNPQVKE